jgi:hypothetical protein
MKNGQAGGGNRIGTGLCLLLAVVLGGLTVVIAYGFSVEYADTAAPPWDLAWHSVRSWSAGIAVTMLACSGSLLSSRGSRPAVIASTAVVASTVLAVGVAGTVGAQHKFERYPSTPNCTDEFTGGPALRVTRQAQAAFEQINHPGPFSGGGSSGVDGCSSELMLRDATNPVERYRDVLPASGWTVASDEPGKLAAEKGGQAFELTRDGNSWWVWIGPLGSGSAVDHAGRFGPDPS